jgi:hypothetical protein
MYLGWKGKSRWQKSAEKNDQPAHQKLAKCVLECGLSYWLGELICDRQAGVNLLDYDTFILDRILKAAILCKMFCVRMELVGFVDKIETASIIFINS